MLKTILLVAVWIATATFIGCYSNEGSPPRYAGDKSQKPPKRKDARLPGTGRKKRDAALTKPKSAKEFQNRVNKHIAQYLGTPYKWGGADRSGMDCSGFVGTVYWKAAAQKMPRSSEGLFLQGQPVPKASLVFGDLVFFENVRNRGVSHVGIYIGENKFAHASTSRGVIKSNLNEKYYKKRYIGARRIYKTGTVQK